MDTIGRGFFTWQGQIYQWLPYSAMKEIMQKYPKNDTSEIVSAVKNSMYFIQLFHKANGNKELQLRRLQSARYWQTVYWTLKQAKNESRRQRQWTKQFPDIPYELRNVYLAQYHGAKGLKEALGKNNKG